MNYRTLLPAVLFALLPAAASAQNITVTEVMSSSGGGGTADWFELSNLTGSTIDITGYRIDDNSLSFGNSAALLGVTNITPGQSVVFLETSNPVVDISAFRTFWGANATSIIIGSYSGSGLSFGSGGDAVEIYTSGGTVVTSVVFGAATTGFSFGYNTVSSTFGANSVAGQFGAYVSANPLGNVGSPGAVPEPSTWALLAGAAALGVAAIRRRQKR